MGEPSARLRQSRVIPIDRNPLWRRRPRGGLVGSTLLVDSAGVALGKPVTISQASDALCMTPVASDTLELDGVALEYRRTGAGEAPLILLLHEALGSLALWKDFPEKLAAAYVLKACHDNLSE